MQMVLRPSLVIYIEIISEEQGLVIMFHPLCSLILEEMQSHVLQQGFSLLPPKLFHCHQILLLETI